MEINDILLMLISYPTSLVPGSISTIQYAILKTGNGDGQEQGYSQSASPYLREREYPS